MDAKLGDSVFSSLTSWRLGLGFFKSLNDFVHGQFVGTGQGLAHGSNCVRLFRGACMAVKHCKRVES